MILLTTNAGAVLRRLLVEATAAEVSYPEVGATRSDGLPIGYNHDRLSVPVGRGEIVWRRAQEAIRTWQAHRHAGIRITPADGRIDEGVTVLASRGVGPALIVAPCRIVYVTVTPTRVGFAYGTLPGHPEQGEEAFHVALDADGRVTAEIAAFSRPAETIVRLAGPVARKIQRIAATRYLEGIRTYAATTA